MVQRLFTFIEASRTRHWLQHLSSAEDLMKGFIAIDLIKFRKAWLVYIADMRSLDDENSEIWNKFMEGNFSVQKNDIPIGCSNWV